MIRDKQLALKPFDFVVAVKVAVNRERDYLIAQLAEEFKVSLSTVHSALTRGEAARLISRSDGPLRAIRPALQEFAISGLKYAFPSALGGAHRGVPTAIGSPVLAKHFESVTGLVPVWPHPEGKVFGMELVPLHPSVPAAAMKDEALYDVLALVDAIRAGTAREREIAENELLARI